MKATSLPLATEIVSQLKSRHRERYFNQRPTRVWGLEMLPADWCEKPLKRVARINTDKLSDATDPDFEIDYVDIGNVNLEQGITSTERLRFEAAPSRARRLVRHGDTIVSTVRTYLKAVAHITNPPDNLVVSTGFAVLRPGRELDPGYLYRLAQSEPFVERLVAHSVGVSYPAINASEIGRFTIPLPPLHEQRAIAALLDHETAKIDKLMDAKRSLRSALRRRHTALIASILTRGDVESLTLCKVKSAGVSWIDTIPEHWKMVPLKYVAQIGNGSTPSRENPSYWNDGNYPWLNSSVVNLDCVTDADQYVTGLALKECHLPRITPPAVLVGITGEGRTRGMATILQIEATINQHLAYLKPKNGRCDVSYLRCVLDLAYQYLRDDSDGGGSTKGAITCEQLGNVRIPIPPYDEQLRITQRIETLGQQAAALVSSLESGVQKLQRLRESLITAAVTGQIDVRNYRPEAPCP